MKSYFSFTCSRNSIIESEEKTRDGWPANVPLGMKSRCSTICFWTTCLQGDLSVDIVREPGLVGSAEQRVDPGFSYVGVDQQDSLLSL